MRAIRGNDISMIFQEPMTSLNPVLTIGRQIAETLMLHQGLEPGGRRRARRRDAAPGRHSRARAAHRAVSARAVGRHAPARHDRHGAGLRSQAADRRRADHGARRHRAGADPRPDAPAQGQDRHRDHPDHARPRRRRRDGAARGRDVRAAARSRRRRSTALFARPRHPYTRALLGSVPRLGSSLARRTGKRLAEIPGVVPSLQGGDSRLHLRAALRARDRALPRELSAARAEGGRATGSPAGKPIGWRSARA